MRFAVSFKRFQGRCNGSALGVAQWTLQQFHSAELIDESLNDTPTWTDKELKAIAASLGPITRVRGTL